MLGPLTYGALRSGGAVSFGDTVLATQSANLIAYWPLNETSGTTADNAEGTAARDGTYTSATLADSTFLNGDAVPLFPGSPAGRVNIYSDSLRDAIDGDEYTIMIAFKPRNIGVWTDGTTRRLYALYTDSSGGRLQLEKGSSNNTLTAYRITTNTRSVTRYTDLDGWIVAFQTCTITGNLWRFWVNGHQITQVANPAAWPTEEALSSTFCTLGAVSNSGTNPINGWLGHAAIWSKALTIAEMEAIWETVRPSGSDVFIVGDSKSIFASVSGLWVDRLFGDLGAGWYERTGRIAIGAYDVGEMDTYLQSNLGAKSNTKPDHILISMGANDAPAPTSENDFTIQLTSIIDQVRAKWPDVSVYVSKPWRSDHSANCDTLAGYIDAVIASYGSGVFAGPDERTWLENGDNGATYTSDGIHYNDAGATEAAAQWAAVLTA